MEYSVKECGKMAKESNDNFFYFNILILTMFIKAFGLRNYFNNGKNIILKFI